MKVMGEEVTQQALKDVTTMMARELSFSVERVRRVLSSHLPQLHDIRRSGVALRAAERVIQRERLRGRIRRTSARGVWEWVDSEPASRAANGRV